MRAGERIWSMDLRCPACDALFTVRTASNDVWETLKTATCPECKGQKRKDTPFIKTGPLIVKIERERG
jgi:hypothetical protein